MEVILPLLLSTISSIIGAISGIGGGVIIKPLLEVINLHSVQSINFLSGCTMLSMSIVTLIRDLQAGNKPTVKVSGILGLGAIFGGVIGGRLFGVVSESLPKLDSLVIIQSSILLAINVRVAL